MENSPIGVYGSQSDHIWICWRWFSCNLQSVNPLFDENGWKRGTFYCLVSSLQKLQTIEVRSSYLQWCYLIRFRRGIHDLSFVFLMLEWQAMPSTIWLFNKLQEGIATKHMDLLWWFSGLVSFYGFLCGVFWFNIRITHCLMFIVNVNLDVLKIG